MKRLFLVLLAVPCLAQEQKPSAVPSLFTISQYSLAASATVDVVSSFQSSGVEANPVLGRGQFGAKQTAIVAGMTGALLLAERPLAKRSPKMRKVFTWLNFGIAGEHGFAAVHNFNLH